MPDRSAAGPETGYKPNGLLAQQVARQIRDTIAARALQPGYFLGREADMHRRLGISRPTLRAALRYLELSGTIATRAGAGGGVFVGQQEDSPAVVALARHVAVLGQPLAVFFSIYMPFFAHAAGLAAVNASSGQRAAMSALVDEMLAAEDRLAWFRPQRQELRMLILRATRMPALELAGAALCRAYVKILEGELRLGDTERAKVRTIKHAEAAFVAPLVAGDRDATLAAFESAAECERAMTRHTIQAGLVPGDSVPHTLFAATPEAADATRLAEHVMRAIRHDIHHDHHASGSPLGSIAEIAARYGVSQETCREALGLLSLHGLVTIRRGRGGGVLAGKPSLQRLGVVIDPELRRCEGLAELQMVITGIRDSIAADPSNWAVTATTIAFLDELVARIVAAIKPC